MNFVNIKDVFYCKYTFKIAFLEVVELPMDPTIVYCFFVCLSLWSVFSTCSLGSKLRQQQRLVERIQVRYVPFSLQVPSPGEKGQAISNCPACTRNAHLTVLQCSNSFRVSSGASLLS